MENFDLSKVKDFQGPELMAVKFSDLMDLMRLANERGEKPKKLQLISRDEAKRRLNCKETKFITLKNSSATKIVMVGKSNVLESSINEEIERLSEKS